MYLIVAALLAAWVLLRTCLHSGVYKGVGFDRVRAHFAMRAQIADLTEELPHRAKLPVSRIH